MALEELMLVNPKGKYPRRKSLQIVFPKPVKHMKVNLSAIDRVKEAGKGLMGDVTIKEVAGGAGGVASTVLIPQYLKPNPKIIPRSIESRSSPYISQILIS